MSSIKQIRHHITKLPFVHPPLTWLQHQGLRTNDVFVASYPRSGSTWLRFMLFEILMERDSDFASVDQAIASVRKHRSTPVILPGEGRLLQTHEPYRQAYQKAIYLVRDVRDVLLSEYYFSRRLQFFNGEFDDFFDSFLSGTVNRYGFWGHHVNSWLDAYAANNKKIHVIKYEDMRQQPEATLKNIVAFLDIDRDTATIERAVENNSVSRMQVKEDKSVKFATNHEGIRFIDQGSSKVKRRQLSETQLARLEQRVEQALTQLNYKRRS